jgi:hypothetical protein
MLLVCACLAALATPAAVMAMTASAGDGSLVVQHANGPHGTPVVELTITGAAIGHIWSGRILIDDATPDNGISPEVTGATWQKGPTASQPAQSWGGTDFKFRVVGGTYTILIYGTDVNVVALGTGQVTLTGLSDTPLSDGTFSLNGGDFHSLPSQSSKLLTIGTAPVSTTG